MLQGRDCLVGPVVKASASGAEDPGSIPACDGIFPGRVIQVSVYCDWVRQKVWSATCLSVATRKIVCADPSLGYTSMLLGR